MKALAVSASSLSTDGAPTKHATYPLVRVEGRLEGATQYVILRPENMRHPLYRVENLSSHTILLRQKPRVTLLARCLVTSSMLAHISTFGCTWAQKEAEKAREKSPTGVSTTVEELAPHSSVAFGMDDPTHDRAVVIKILSNSSDIRHTLMAVPLDEFKRYGDIPLTPA